jgi:hypothetical protein
VIRHLQDTCIHAETERETRPQTYLTATVKLLTDVISLQKS